MIARTYIYLAAIVFFIPSAAAQERGRSTKIVKDAVSCNEFAPVVKQVIGQPVGVEQCSIISEETVFNIKGQKFRRIEVRLGGAVDGWASREKGSRAIYFTDGPDFVLAQSGLTGPRSRGVGKYEAATGHGLTIFYPEDRATGTASFLSPRTARVLTPPSERWSRVIPRASSMRSPTSIATWA